MLDNISKPAQVAGKGVSELQQKIDNLEKASASITKTGVTMATVGSSITKAVLSPVEATVETGKALGTLKSVGVKDLNTLETAAEDFSNTWSGTSKANFIASAYDIKSAISTLTDEGVAKYTEFSGLTAKATKGAVSEMSNLFAIGYGIYKGYYKDLNDIQFGEMFSAGIAATANIFRAEGKTISDAIQTLGASATQAKRPLIEQLSVLGMLMQTMSGSEAGTKYRSFIKNAAKAGEELGISFMDNNKNLLGMSEILDRLRKKFGESLDAQEKLKIQKAFGDDEAVALVDLLYTKVGDLNGNLKTMGEMMGKGTILTKDMAGAMNQDIGSQYEVATQQFHNMYEVLGKELIPVLIPLIQSGSRAIQEFTQWSRENHDLVRSVMLILLCLGPLITVLGSVITLGGVLGFSLANIMKGFNVLSSAVKVAIGLYETFYLKGLYASEALSSALSQLRIGASLTVNSIKNISLSVINFAKTAAISGVNAIKSFAVSLAQMTVEAVHIAVTAVSSLISSIKTASLSILNFAKTAAINGVNAIKSFIVGLAQMTIQAIRTAVTALPGLISATWAFTAALLANPVTWIVIGIVALSAAIILLWRNWDAVSKWLSSVWNACINGIITGLNVAKAFFAKYGISILAVLLPLIGLPLLIIKNWNVIAPYFGNILNAVKAKFNEVINYIKGLGTTFAQSGKGLWDAFTSGITKVINAPYNAVKSGLDKLRKLLPFSDAKEGPLSTLTRSGRALMDTLATGVQQNAPALKTATSNAFAESIDTSKYARTLKESSSKETSFISRDVKKVNLREVFRESNNSQSRETIREKDSGRNVVIQKVVIEHKGGNLDDLIDDIIAFSDSN